MKGDDHDATHTIQQMVELAEKARRDGLLALEDDLAEIDDDYTRKGLQLVVDGTDSDLVRSILQSEVDGDGAAPPPGRTELQPPPAASRRRSGSSAPSWASSTCSSTSTTPALLGHSIAGAFIATLYGVGSANLIFLPIANKLKEHVGRGGRTTATMLLEAILSIQAGDNPRLLAEKLETFILPAERRQGKAEEARLRPSRLSGGGMSGRRGRGAPGGGGEHGAR